MSPDLFTPMPNGRYWARRWCKCGVKTSDLWSILHRYAQKTRKISVERMDHTHEVVGSVAQRPFARLADRNGQRVFFLIEIITYVGGNACGCRSEVPFERLGATRTHLLGQCHVIVHPDADPDGRHQAEDQHDHAQPARPLDLPPHEQPREAPEHHDSRHRVHDAGPPPL